MSNINYKIAIKVSWLSDSIPDNGHYKVCKFTIFNLYNYTEVDATITNPTITFNHENWLKPAYFKQCFPIAFSNKTPKSTYTVCLKDDISIIFPQESGSFYIGFIIDSTLNIDFFHNNNTPSGFYIDDTAICYY